MDATRAMNAANLLRIAALKRRARALAIDLHKAHDDYGCGDALATYLSPRISTLRAELDVVLTELRELDPACPGYVGPVKKIANPASLTDQWAPDFEVGGGCWLCSTDNHCYTVAAIYDDGGGPSSSFLIDFIGGDGTKMTLKVTDAAKLMRPT